MDAVQNFNDELQSLNDIKPPVSKAKMGLITRAAMKSVKFYKHIVQGVEKFIAKCRPEYKIPGLYVIDSIVRQSRHQFGPERDVYAARFARNFPVTFDNLFSGCVPEDKPKIVRVLNLWQKNGVFAAHVISPLLDMANPNTSNPLSESLMSNNDSPDVSDLLSQGHHYSRTNSSSHAGSSTKHHHSSSDTSNIRFNKNLSDGFKYDDDDDDGDETPTEAEPPLKLSKQSKIELEQRVSNETPPIQNQSSQQVPLHHHSSSSSRRSKPDRVLERFQTLFNNNSIRNDSLSNLSSNSIGSRGRSRSRSPPPPIVYEKQSSPRVNSQSKSAIKETNSEVISEKESERRAERRRKCLPEIKDKHLTVCSSTLWLGHVPKTVSEADISDAFGEFGTITSIDLIPPRGCAYVCMDRRQDAKKALTESRDLKLNGSHIKLAWAPGKGFKEYKKLKDFWEVSIGASYIPYAKIDASIDFDVLEEGGVIDEDSMSMEMRERREKKAREKEDKNSVPKPSDSLPVPTLPILSQPPPFSMPPPNLGIPPPTALSQSSVLGGIPFPPPIVTTSSSQLSQVKPPPIFDNNGESTQDSDTHQETGNSPKSLDQQLSMTERQISMVEQQLNMMQHAQAHSMNPQQPNLAHLHQQALFGQAPNPLIFDIPPHMMASHHFMDPNQQIPIFANSQQQLLNQPPQMLPMNPTSMNSNVNGNFRY